MSRWDESQVVSVHWPLTPALTPTVISGGSCTIFFAFSDADSQYFFFFWGGGGGGGVGGLDILGSDRCLDFSWHVRHLDLLLKLTYYSLGPFPQPSIWMHVTENKLENDAIFLGRWFPVPFFPDKSIHILGSERTLSGLFWTSHMHGLAPEVDWWLMFPQPSIWKHGTENKLANHFVYAPSQWEMTLQYNSVYHWLGVCTKWSLS